MCFASDFMHNALNSPATFPRILGMTPLTNLWCEVPSVVEKVSTLLKDIAMSVLGMSRKNVARHTQIRTPRGSTRQGRAGCSQLLNPRIVHCAAACAVVRLSHTRYCKSRRNRLSGTLHLEFRAQSSSACHGSIRVVRGAACAARTTKACVGDRRAYASCSKLKDARCRYL